MLVACFRFAERRTRPPACGGLEMLVRQPSVRATARRRLVLAGTATLLVMLLGLPAQAAAAGPRPSLPRGPLHDGIFLSVCLPSHVAKDDPIVHPGEPGASHQHEFFGNTTTDANSTYASLRAGETTCRIAADKAGYWVPTLFADGVRVAPIRVNAYYLRGRGPGRTVAFPAGLKVVAGDGEATAPQSTAITGWKCSGIQGTALQADPVVCPGGSHAVLVIRFPDCWNGKDLDSADHKSHLAYRAGRACPAGYPVRIPRLSLNVHYDLPSTDNLTLASGSIHSAHADFFNAWNQPVLARLVRANLN
jgi:hypothetical protein